VQYPTWIGFNSAIPNTNFTLENEVDITIAKEHDSLSFETCRKPTTTDVTIPNDSCNPREHKTAAVRHFCKRMNTYKLIPESLQKKNAVHQILVNNNYEASTMNKFSKKKKTRKRTRHSERKMVKIYIYRKGNEFYYKTVKNTDVNVTFTTYNTIERRLGTKQGTDQNKYNKSGIYQLTSPDCKMKYTGQTGRSSKPGFRSI
jgi:hypothetical protein